MLYLITSYTVRQNMVLVGRLRKARVKLKIKIRCKSIKGKENWFVYNIKKILKDLLLMKILLLWSWQAKMAPFWCMCSILVHFQFCTRDLWLLIKHTLSGVERQGCKSSKFMSQFWELFGISGKSLGICRFGRFHEFITKFDNIPGFVAS